MFSLGTAISLSAICVAPIAAQRTIVVTGGGTALQQGIDAAAPGDVVDVRVGSPLFDRERPFAVGRLSVAAVRRLIA